MLNEHNDENDPCLRVSMEIFPDEGWTKQQLQGLKYEANMETQNTAVILMLNAIRSKRV